MIRIKVDRSPSPLGIGIYVSKKAWNLRNDGEWFGPSFVFHIFNRTIRIYWIIAEESKS